MRETVRVVEVGPRDGLQNEENILSVENRVELIKRLADAGLRAIEIGAFVSPRWVPQMVGTDQVVSEVEKLQSKGKISSDVQISTLVPNEKGMMDALSSGIKEVSVFGSCSEAFSKKNTNCSIDESFTRFKKVMSLATPKNIKVRGYLSVAFGCPYEAEVSQDRVVDLIGQMFELGIYEISVGDTIGVATPKQVQALIEKIKKTEDLNKIAMHFHDTRGTALANVLASYQLGVRSFDSSLGGLGGCPYASGAAGNLATEDLVYMLHGMDVETSINLSELIKVTEWIEKILNHSLPARVAKAGVGPLAPTRG